jgi:hypothetical protein
LRKKVGPWLAWGLAGAVGLLLCLILGGSWWLSRSESHFVDAALPTVNTTPNMAIFTDKETYWASGPETELIQMRGHLNAGESVSIPVDIDSLGEVTFVLIWDGEKHPVFSLTRPDGQLIDEPYANTHPEEAVFGVAMYYGEVAYSVKKASVGLWQVHLSALAAGNYVLSGSLSDAKLVFSVASDMRSYYAGDIATIGAKLENNGVGLAGATITARVLLPDSTVQTAMLKDMGNGLYAMVYRVPDVSSISFDIVARGSNQGVQFMRTGSIWIQAIHSDIKLTGEYADHLEEKDGHKMLDVKMGVDSGRAGEYVFQGQLMAGARVVSTAATKVLLSPGYNLVVLRFQGDDFRFWHLDGPYTLAWVTIDELGGEGGSSPFIKNNWQTTAYHWKDFGPEICFKLTMNLMPDPSAGSFTASPKPNCKNGQYLSTTEITLTAKANPGFQFDRWYVNVGGVNHSSPAIATFTIIRDTTATVFFVDNLH